VNNSITFKRRRIHGHRRESDICDTFENIADGLFGIRGRAKNELDTFVRIHKIFEQRRKKINQSLRRGRNPHAARERLFAAGNALAHRFRLVKYLSRRFDCRTPCVGQLHAAFSSKEQLNAELVFKRLYLMADGGLREIKSFGRFREIKRVGDLAKCS
jgi:hypothetical protein